MKPQLPSTLPAVIDGWLELFAEVTADTAPDGPLKGVQVIDGPARKLSEIQDDSIIIAPGDQTSPGAVSTLEPQPSLGPRAYVERVEVTMTLASYAGNTTMKPRRDRAAAMLAGVKALVDANQVRPDVWDQANMGFAIDWYPTQNEAGCTVEVAFTLVTKSIV